MKQLKTTSNISEREYCTRGELPALLGVGQWTCDKLVKQANAGARVDGRIIIDVRKIRNYINSICGNGDDVLEMKELRCKQCNRLLGRSNGEAEIKCPKCSALNIFNVE